MNFVSKLKILENNLAENANLLKKNGYCVRIHVTENIFKIVIKNLTLLKKNNCFVTECYFQK